MRLFSLLVCAVALLGCEGTPDGGLDAAPGIDAAPDPDAGEPLDGGLDASSPADAGRACDVTPGDFTIDVDVGGSARIYQLHVPVGMSASAPAPVLIGLHGGGGRGEYVELGLGLSALAAREKVLVVYGEGTVIDGLPFVARSWNAGACCRTATDLAVDDTAYVGAVLDDLIASRCVDEDRVFVTGLSNGAMMAHRLACELSDRVAAVAPVGAALADRDLTSCLEACAAPSPYQRQCLGACGAALPTFFDCSPARPVPLLQIHGRLDANAPYDGGVGANAAASPAPVHPRVDDAIEEYRLRNGCSSETAETHRDGETVCTRFTSCTDGAHVELCSVADGGHTWPGGNPDSPVCYRSDAASMSLCADYLNGLGPISEQLDALEHMWSFFVEHPRR